MNFEEIYLANERKANNTVMWAEIVVAIVIFVYLGFICIWYPNDLGEIIMYMLPGAFIVLAAAFTNFLWGDKLIKIEKDILISALMICIVMVFAMLVTTPQIIFMLPIVLSCRYYNKKFIIRTAITSYIMIIVAWILGVQANVGIDVNCVHFEPGSSIIVPASGWIEDLLCNGDYSFAERFSWYYASILADVLILSAFTVAAFGICNSGIEMMKQHMETAGAMASREKELSIATNIQESMLPTNFTSYGAQNEADIYATMYAAKEVGGDFYDFYKTDDTHVAITIGDVSGKGVTAALFMVKAQTTLKDMAMSGLAPEDVLRRTNAALSENNVAGLFVTIWFGILDLKTGVLNYAVGGHNPPLLKRVGGEFEFVKVDPNFIVGVIPELTYKPDSIKLEIGDKLFLYTDGVTEARNINNEFYGDEELRRVLNINSESVSEKIIVDMKQNLEDFKGEASQFDDVTMLSLEIKKLL